MLRIPDKLVKSINFGAGIMIGKWNVTVYATFSLNAVAERRATEHRAVYQTVEPGQSLWIADTLGPVMWGGGAKNLLCSSCPTPRA